MNRNRRRDPRFDNMGRVESYQICALPGVLEDISKSGCRVRFPISTEVDMEDDYPLTIKFPQKESSPSPTLELIARPVWKNATENGSLQIGFSFLLSHDTNALNAFIEKLSITTKTPEEQIEELIISPTVSFVL